MRSLTLVAASLFLRGAVAQSPANLVASSLSGALSALTYTNVGGSGSYNQVTQLVPGSWPSCDVSPSCVTSPKSVSGNLAPFDEDMTVVFRGPMTIQNIAVYQPDSDATTWNLVSSWAQGSQPNNLVFMNNNGGGASGEWSVCGGASQSYANGTWNGAAASANADTYSGWLDETNEVNIMTATTCAEATCDGFSRGTANLGWAGSKMIVTTFDMPPSTDPSNVPAIWALNGQVVRAAQYGCNCRGEGSPGGCGELDILETLSASGDNVNQGISEIYSFKGATGSGGNYFPRPTSGLVTYGVVFDVQTDTIAIQQYTSWDYTQTSMTRSLVEEYLSVAALSVAFGTDNVFSSTDLGTSSSGDSAPAGSASPSSSPAASSAASASSSTPTCNKNSRRSTKRSAHHRRAHHNL